MGCPSSKPVEVDADGVEISGKKLQKMRLNTSRSSSDTYSERDDEAPRNPKIKATFTAARAPPPPPPPPSSAAAAKALALLDPARPAPGKAMSPPPPPTQPTQPTTAAAKAPARQACVLSSPATRQTCTVALPAAEQQQKRPNAEAEAAAAKATATAAAAAAAKAKATAAAAAAAAARAAAAAAAVNGAAEAIGRHPPTLPPAARFIPGMEVAQVRGWR